MGAYDDGGFTRAAAAAEAAGIPTQAATPAVRVTVKRGDTLSEIAAANGLTTKEVLAMNPALKSDPKYNGGRTIFAGTKVTISPAVKATATKPTITNPGNGGNTGSDGSNDNSNNNNSNNNDDTINNTDTGIIVGDALPRTFIYATPPTPTLQIMTAPPTPPVKTATLDIILFDEQSVPADGMFDQIFENIGGQELISITRSDIVNGQKISYQPIKNLSAIQKRYNPNNILSLQQTADKFFSGFSIKLEDKIPKIGNGTNGENVYLNATGDLIIEFININPDEQVETQISVSGTIYEADLGDYTS